MTGWGVVLIRNLGVQGDSAPRNCRPLCRRRPSLPPFHPQWVGCVGGELGIEAQERIYYALAGNIALNNCFNARAMHAAATSKPGTMKIPTPDYLTAASFGSLELRKQQNAEFIGQSVDYSEEKMVNVRTVSLDSLGFSRLDLIKLDIEGMEIEALAGGAKGSSKNKSVNLDALTHTIAPI